MNYTWKGVKCQVPDKKLIFVLKLEALHMDTEKMRQDLGGGNVTFEPGCRKMY